MGRTRESDGVEAFVRKADETVEQWLRRGAGMLRKQLGGLQVGLRKLGDGLEQLERQRKAGQKPMTAKGRTRRRAAAARKPARTRRTKKAA